MLPSGSGPLSTSAGGAAGGFSAAARGGGGFPGLVGGALAGGLAASASGDPSTNNAAGGAIGGLSGGFLSGLLTKRPGNNSLPLTGGALGLADGLAGRLTQDITNELLKTHICNCGGN